MKSIKKVNSNIVKKNKGNHYILSLQSSCKHHYAYIYDSDKSNTLLCINTLQSIFKEVEKENKKSYNNIGVDVLGDLIGKESLLRGYKLIFNRTSKYGTGKTESFLKAVRRYIEI